MKSKIFISSIVTGLLLTIPGQARAQVTEAQVAAANVEAGVAVFSRCKACHTIEEDGPHRVGPNLWSVVGRPVASVEAFTRYSPALQEFGGEWTVEKLDAFLKNPRATVPGTRMAFAGLPGDDDRANLIAYMNANSAAPLEFGLAEVTGEESDSDEMEMAETDTGADYGRLVDAPGAEETFIYCTACHSEMIVAQQGKTREHWEDLFVWMREEQGMADIPEPERTKILDYLEANYNEDRPNFPRQ